VLKNYKILRLPLVFLLIIWGVFAIEHLGGYNFAQYGIYPKDFKGLLGIFLSTFIHGDLEHLYNNSVPLLVLLSILSYFYGKKKYFIVIFGIIFSGLITWLIGRPSFHIGASGLIYVLVSFIFFKGLLTKNYQLSALSFVVVFLYGGMIWYMFPNMKDGMSWEGHLGGFLTGIILALFIDTPEQYQKLYRYEWEDPNFNRYRDPFMKHFDEKGNFVPNPHIHTTSTENIKIKYVFIQEEEKEVDESPKKNSMPDNSQITNP